MNSTHAYIPIYLLNILTGLGVIFVILRKKIETWHYLLIVFSLVIVVGISFQLLYKLNVLSAIREITLERIASYTVFLMSVVYCFISFNFTRSFTTKYLWIGISLLGTGVVFVFLEVPELFSEILSYPVGNEILIAGWGFFLSISLIHMFFTYRKTVYSLHRNRYKYWLLEVAVFISGSVLVFNRQDTAGLSLCTTSAIFISIISLSYRLADIRQIFKRTTAYLLTTLLSVSAYAGAFILFESLPGSRTFHPAASFGLALIFAAALVILANPLINIFHRWVSRLISGSNLDSSHILGSYSKDITNIIDIHQLAHAIVTKITDGMKFRYGELFTLEKADDIFVIRLIHRAGNESSPTQRIHHLDLNSAIAQWFIHERRCITQYDLDFHPKLLQADLNEKDWISKYGMDIFVPIYSKDEWIGILALGPKENGDRIFEEEVGILQSLADQTSVGLRNARLYEDLRRQNAANEKLNQDLSNANEELSRLDQAKSDFISIASHEIRTPLTQIIGYNDILNDMVKGGNIPRAAGLQMTDGVRKAAKRLEDIVDTMFDVSKLDTRTLTLNVTEVLLVDTFAQLLDKWGMALEDRNLTLSLEGLKELPPIQGDSRRLLQVFSNLLQNSIKYTPDSGQIRVIGRNDTQNGSFQMPCIEVIISDTGIGISADDIEKIFVKFYRVGNVMLHSSGETKFKGAGPGLGLTIARGIVEAHGGKIWAESTGNDDTLCPGSAFHVVLPIAQSDIS